MQQIITIYDYLLLPFYLFIFFLVVRKKAQKYNGTSLKKFFYLAFLLHMLGAIFLSLLLQYYYGYGDSFGYYTGGDVLRKMISKDFSSIKYFFSSGEEMYAAAQATGFGDITPITMNGDANAVIMKISTLLSYISFNCFLPISLFFGFFSFIGSWKLFYVLQKLNGERHVNLLGIATIVTPSLWFWGSALLKEPICIGALGIAVYILYKSIYKTGFKLKNILLLLLMFYIITIVKSYITALFVASVLLVFVWRFFGTIKNIILKTIAILFFLFFVTVAALSIDVAGTLQQIVISSYSQIESYKNNYEAVQEDYEDSRAGFSIGDINPTLGSLILKSPKVIVSCLFRPFLWESRKIIILFAAFETFFVLIATLFVLFKTRIFGFFYYCFNDPVRLFCFIFSILFALVIGYTTFNFGTMARYKIIFLPFYFFLLINIYTVSSAKKEETKKLANENLELEI